MLKKLLSFVFISLLLTGCQPAETLDVDFSEFYVQKIVDAIETDNYEMFSDNFSDVMKNALPEESFVALANSIHDQLGHYQELNFYSAELTTSDNVEYIVVVYRVSFEEDENVFLTTTFLELDEGYSVEGLFINSNKLK